jgi:hypothetical protein
MQQGYTTDELEEKDRRRAVRRSFFQKSRRLEKDLRLDKFWPLYKRLREAMRAELERSVPVVDEAQLDTYLEFQIPKAAEALARLLADDMAARASRAIIEQGGP